MLTKNLKIKGDWQEVVDDCRATVGKESLGKEPSRRFKRGILIAEHSPIRDIIFRWRWPGMPHWVTVHFARHKWEKFIRTQRTDRTGIDRTELPQDEPQDFTGQANVQHLIDTARKRLCYQASPETRAYMEDLKAEIHKTQPEIADVLVPNCIYRCGCPEMSMCKEHKWLEYRRRSQEAVRQDSIATRYDAYNEIFWEDRESAPDK